MRRRASAIYIRITDASKSYAERNRNGHHNYTILSNMLTNETAIGPSVPRVCRERFCRRSCSLFRVISGVAKESCYFIDLLPPFPSFLFFRVFMFLARSFSLPSIFWSCETEILWCWPPDIHRMIELNSGGRLPPCQQLTHHALPRVLRVICSLLSNEAIWKSWDSSERFVGVSVRWMVHMPRLRSPIRYFVSTLFQ